MKKITAMTQDLANLREVLRDETRPLADRLVTIDAGLAEAELDLLTLRSALLLAVDRLASQLPLEVFDDGG